MKRLFPQLIAFALCVHLLPLQAQEQVHGARTRADEALANQISALFCALHLPFDYVVDPGIVRLSGQVNTRAERRTIVQDVRAMSGVRKVTNGIAISKVWVGAGCSGAEIGTGSGAAKGSQPSR